MPLVTRQANQGNLFNQAVEPPDWLDGDLWSDTTANILNLNVGGTATAVGLALDEVHTWTADQSYDDNVNITLGTGGDADLAYDGTNLILNPRVVGSGNLEFAAGLSFSTLRKHFTEYFVGTALNALWTFTETGAGTSAIITGEGLGWRYTTPATSGARGFISFNAVNNFAGQACTLWAAQSAEDTTSQDVRTGIADLADPIGGGGNFALFELNGVLANFQLFTRDGTTSSRTAGGIVKASASTFYKIIVNGTNVRLFQVSSGVWTLDITKTTNIPGDVDVSPSATISTLSANAHFGGMEYCRIEND